MREVRDRLVAHLPALTPRAAQQMRLVVPRRTVLTHIVTTVCSHVYGPTTFSHTTKLPDRHIDSVTISDDTPDASDTTSPQVTQRINPQRARNFGLEAPAGHPIQGTKTLLKPPSTGSPTPRHTTR